MELAATSAFVSCGTGPLEPDDDDNVGPGSDVKCHIHTQTKAHTIDKNWNESAHNRTCGTPLEPTAQRGRGKNKNRAHSESHRPMERQLHHHNEAHTKEDPGRKRKEVSGKNAVQVH